MPVAGRLPRAAGAGRGGGTGGRRARRRCCSVFQRIADAHINVRYSYLATGNRLVVAAADPEAVIAALRH